MAISVFDLFSIGIGPSSSHTVGPMRAVKIFADFLASTHQLEKTAAVRTELFGSLGLTGRGHGTDRAVLLGLEGDSPESIDPDTIESRLAEIRKNQKLNLLGKKIISFMENDHLIFHRSKRLPQHSNGMRCMALDENGSELASKVYFSVGGGFVVKEDEWGHAQLVEDETPLPFAFRTGAELLEIGKKNGKTIAELMLQNELCWRSESEIKSGLLKIWDIMQACVKRGCSTPGILPGGLKVERRAPKLFAKLSSQTDAIKHDPLTVMDWVNLFALAVNEENAGGGRVVTAPTNGAAGIIPAVMHYMTRFTDGGHEQDRVVTFLLTAAAIGILYKTNASISGAEVGCQGEVGVACSMAAGGLTAALGGSNEQIENAAEIGMEHNLGLTCDPIGGLVQIPCIERNAMGSMKAINAARIALQGDGSHKVSLDKVIKTMMQTGKDMQSKYKETSRGGLAINVVEC